MKDRRSKKIEFDFLFLSLCISLLIQNSGFTNNTIPSHFERLSIDQGLTSNIVYCMLQDQYGFMWFGTANGLNRYDGYNFKTFKYQPNNTNSLSSNFINAILEDSNGNLWIGTDKGLNRFNTKTGKFSRFLNVVNDSNSISNNVIKAILEDSNGDIWVGTHGGGVNRIRSNQKNNEEIAFEHFSFNSIKANNILTLYYDEQNLWLGTESCLILMNKEADSKTFNTYYYPFFGSYNISINGITKGTNNSLLVLTFEDGLFEFIWSEKDLNKNNREQKPVIRKIENKESDLINSCFIDSEGHLWIAGRGDGILFYPHFENNQTNYFNIRHNPEDLNSISGDFVSCFFEDNSGVIWILTENNGICKFIPSTKPFKIVGKKSNISKQLRYIITAIETKNGNLIFGTRNNGLQRILYSQKQDSWVDLNRLNWMENKNVRKIFKDESNNLWMATGNSGIKVFSPNGKLIKHFLNEVDTNSLSNNYVYEIFKDSKGLIWIGTWGGTWGGGLDLFNPEDESFVNFTHNPEDETSISQNIVLSIEEDARGNIWIGTKSAGLNLLMRNDKGYYFKRFKNIALDSTSLNDDHVTDIFKSSDGNLWISTESGLNKYNSSTQDFENITLSSELINLPILDIKEDINGNLWMATHKGIAKYNPKSKNAILFDSSDGLHSGYIEGLMHRKSNELIFYGNNGMVQFNPEKIEINTKIPQVVISDIQIFNLIKEKSENASLNLTIPSKNKITLPFKENNFSLTFAALNYIHPEKNKYAYRLEGYDEENYWNYPQSNQRMVNYSNLREGKYVFKVKASNNDGVWNEEGKSLQIIIQPPYYRTKLAYITYFLFISGLLFLFIRLIIKREEQKNKIRFEQLERKKIEELNQMRLSFFTNISHEFRTPLTLIAAPIEKLINSDNLAEEERNAIYRGISKNASRLLRLINELMDFRKLESGKLEMNFQNTEVVGFLRDICSNFEEIAREKMIRFDFNASFKKYYSHIDPGKIEKVIFNLLSNSLNHTPNGGQVSLNFEVSQNKDMIIQVSDSGKGIPENEIDKIFERFIQASSNIYNRGTGIGLHLAKSFVEMHNGSINVQSVQNKKTTFTVVLPIKDDSGIQENLITSKSQYIIYSGENQGVEEFEETSQKLTAETESKKSLLVVDDNPEIRAFLKNELKSKYKIFEAEHGKQGLEVAAKDSPDLIISDVMMPEMDGFEFCKTIKTNIITSHIPVILLTAKTADESLIEGLETGADAYISKPFKLKHLEVRIRKLLENRQKLRQIYSNSINPEPQIITTNTTDEKFLKATIEYIEQNLDEQSLNIESLCKELGMSKTALNNKLKAITGKSTGDFIRSIRLKNAAKLLKNGQMNVKEVCYSVGFNTMWYFSKCFKNEFNVLPSDFAKKA